MSTIFRAPSISSEYIRAAPYISSEYIRAHQVSLVSAIKSVHQVSQVSTIIRAPGISSEYIRAPGI